MTESEYVTVEYSSGPVPRSMDLFYNCLLCGDLIPSIPRRSLNCRCGNVLIDTDYFRLDVRDWSAFVVLQKPPVASSTSAESVHESIYNSLGRLLERYDEGTFVIIEDARTGKFVQFAGVPSQGLVFDLPSEPMSDKELARANKVLSVFGVHFSEWDLFDRPGGKVVGKRSGFSHIVGSDKDAAMKLVMLVFQKIYRSQIPIELTLVES